MRAASIIGVLASLLLTAASAAAQDDDAVVPGRLFPVSGKLFAVAGEPPPPGTLAQVPDVRFTVLFEPDRRPEVLVPLYWWLITLNAMDIRSTRQGLATGRAREANPLMKPFVKNTGAFIGVKAALTVGTIYFAERARRKHPKKVLVWMIATDAALAAIVAHNYRVLRHP